MDIEEAIGNGRDIILQAFHWNLVKTDGRGTLAGRERSWYRILRDMVPEITRLGVTIVYLPPPWVDDSHWEADGCSGGGEGYFWHDFCLDSLYGNKAELCELVFALHDEGLKAIVDLVPNHRDALRMNQDCWPYPGECWRLGGADDGGAFLDGTFDLNLSHPLVQERLLVALEELLDECGVDGWRWDFVWGYDIAHVPDWIRRTRKVEYFSMGEYWQADPDLDGDPLIALYGRDERNRILGWARNSGSCAYDICLKREIQTANPANLRYGLNASAAPEDRRRLVTFVDNHDTGASPWCAANGWGQKHWECPPHFKSQAYAYILSMPGIPCIYWPDCFDWGHGEQIASLIAARRRADIAADAEWRDLTPQHSGFAGIVMDTEGREALALSIGSDYQGPGAGWEIAAHHPGQWSVWVRE